MGLEVVGDLSVHTASLWHWGPDCRLWAGFLWRCPGCAPAVPRLLGGRGSLCLCGIEGITAIWRRDGASGRRGL